MKKYISIFLLLLLLSLGGCATDYASGSDSGASSTCKKAVKNNLKSPGSAKFHDVSSSGDKSSGWDTSGSVDSQNGFGALVRSTFTCHTTLDDEIYHSDVTAFADGGDR